MTMIELRELLGWCTLINIGLLMFSTLAVLGLKNSIIKLHAKLFGVDEQAMPLLYMQYVAAFKLLVIVFNLVPYIALRIMS